MAHVAHPAHCPLYQALKKSQCGTRSGTSGTHPNKFKKARRKKKERSVIDITGGKVRDKDFLESSTEYKLTQWGLYMRKVGVYGCLSMSEGLRRLDDPEICEDQAFWVEKGVATLKRRDRRMAGLLIDHYAKGRIQQELAEIYGISRRTIGGHLRGAEAWMDCWFSSHENLLLDSVLTS